MKLRPCSQWLVVFGGEKMCRSRVDIEKGDGWVMCCGDLMFCGDGGLGGGWVW